MFDIGFSELIVIGIVALVVIGPERLPKVARTLGHLFGKLQRYVTQVKSDISREMEMAELGKVKTEFEDAARSFKSSVESTTAEAEREMRDAQSAIDRALVEEPPVEPSPESPPGTSPASPQMELGIDEQPAPRHRAAGG